MDTSSEWAQWLEDLRSLPDVEPEPVPTLDLPEGYRLVRTCMACPEQYDLVGPDGEMAAYFRLRHGHFYVACPDVGGEMVYSTGFDDGWKGCFESDEERKIQLQVGIDAALKWHSDQKPAS